MKGFLLVISSGMFSHKDYSTHITNTYRFKLVTVVVPNELSPHICTWSFIWVVKFKYCSIDTMWLWNCVYPITPGPLAI